MYPIQVAENLHSVAIHLLRGLRKEDVAAGVGQARLSALSVLVFGGPATLGELARAEQVKPPTMTRIVGGLERDGLVRRRRDERDGRRVRVAATPKGQRVLLEARNRRIQVLSRRIERLLPEEIEILNDAVEILDRVFGRESLSRIQSVGG